VLGFIFGGALFLRVLFLTLTGQNKAEEGFDAIALGTPEYVGILGGFVVAMVVLGLLLGTGRVRTAWSMGKGLVPPIIVIGVVLGSIYGGITGITEAAGMGVVAVTFISFFRGELSLGLIWDSLMRTLKSTGTIIWVTIGATALAGAYTIAGGPQYVANLIIGAELPTMSIILVMMVIFLFMGAFMDWVGIVLLVMPVFLPIVLRLPVEEIGVFGELDPRHVAIWFGVVFCMNMQVSFLSPPFGPAAFYLKSVAPPHISLTDIFRGFLPFIGIQLLALSVLLIWPNIIAVFL
jgi:TRAP-type mannitol/chloroaromatic compound transport system permease large subunit